MASNVNWHGDKLMRHVITQAVIPGMDRAADVMRNVAIRFLARPGSGIHYKRMRARSSAPGEPPVAQTGGGLMDSIQVDRSGLKFTTRTKMLNVFVGTNKEQDKGKKAYPYLLEFGSPGGQLKPRPWLRPTFDKTRRKALNVIQSKIARALLSFDGPR